MENKIKLALFAVAVIIVMIGLFQFKILGSTATQDQYQTQQVQRGTIISSVSSSGQIASTNNVAVTTQASGVVKEIYVRNGGYIEAGKPIAKITLDQTALQKQAASWASYSSALSQLKTAQQSKLAADAQMWTDQKAVLDAQNNVDFKNNNINNPSTKQAYTDLEKQSIDSALVEARKSFTASETKYKEADAAITSAQAQVNSAWLSYQQLSDTVTAPISGSVTGLTLQVGSVITSSGNNSSSASTASTSQSSTNTSTGSSQKIASVVTNATPSVTVNASEIDAPKTKVGQKATITVDALPGKTFTGKVYSIDTTGSVSSGVTTYPVVINLDFTAPDVFPNMSTTANIITATKDNVLTVPSSAIQTSSGQSTVQVKKNGQVSTVTVETGISSDTQTEIISGLSEGDEVVTSVTSTRSSQSGNSSRSVFSPGTFGIRTGGFGGAGGFGGGNGTNRRIGQ